MRLDHLLSKETSSRAKASTSNVLRSVQGFLSSLRSSVIQFRGYRKMYLRKDVEAKYGPIAQLARAHD